MVSSSFFTDGPTNTGSVVAPAAPAAFYADPAAAAASAQQAADAAATAAASAAAASTAAAAAVAAVSGKANVDSPTFTGVPAAPTPSNGDNSTRLATTAWVQANAVGSAPATVAPVMDGTAAVGVSAKYARQDHVHPTDTSRAAVSYVDAQIATVAAVSYVDAQDATKAPLASPALTGVPTAPTPTAGDNSTKIATTAFVQTAAAPDPSLMRGYIAGLTLSTAGSSTTFGVSAGVVVDSTSASFMKLASAFTKTTSAWAAGSGNGSLDTGGTGANTWYHVHAIKNPTTSAVDILTSLSATAPTLPSGYTLFRRIGSMRTNGGGQWLKFFQNGDEFLWDVPVADATALAITTTPSNVTLTVPPGVMVDAILQGDFTNSAVAQSLALVYSPNGSAQAAGTPGGNWTLSNAVSGIFVTNALYALTNTSAQVAVVAGSASNNSLYLITKGWVDSRGRYA